MARTANLHPSPCSPRAPRRPPWGVVALLSLVLAGDTMWWVWYRPQEVTRVTDWAAYLLGMRCCECASRLSEEFYGWHDQERGTWRFGFDRLNPDDPPVLRVSWHGYRHRDGLWAKCVTSVGWNMTLHLMDRRVADEFSERFAESDALKMLAWIEKTDVPASCTSWDALRQAMQSVKPDVGVAASLVGQHWVWGRTPSTYFPLAIAHDTIMALLSAVWLGALAAVALRTRAWHREKVRRRGACCGSCGYELVGLPSPLCPECGRDNGQREAVAQGSRYTGPDASG